MITGYTVTLGAEEFRHNVSGWILINVSANEEENIISQMIAMPEISRLYTTNGRWDLAGRNPDTNSGSLRCRDLASAADPGIKETDTSLLLSARIG